MTLSGKLRDIASRWLLPPGIAELLTASNNAPGCKKVVAQSLLDRNRSLANCWRGQRCFILATGPSIKNQNLAALAGEICISVNQFYLHDDIETINPRIHVVAPSHEPFAFDMANEVLDGAGKKLPDDCKLFLGCTDYEYSFQNAIARRKDLSVEDFHYIDYTGYPALDSYNYSDEALWDIAASPFAPRTVIYCALQLAAYAGCSEVYLLGCDHDYLHDMQRVTNHHFYAEDKGISDAEHLGSFSTEKWFQEYYLRWMQYRLMREALAQRNIKIFNATEGGMLDVFERVDFATLLTKIASDNGAAL